MDFEWFLSLLLRCVCSLVTCLPFTDTASRLTSGQLVSSPTFCSVGFLRSVGTHWRLKPTNQSPHFLTRSIHLYSSGVDQEALFQQILQGLLDFPAPYWDNVSDSAKVGAWKSATLYPLVNMSGLWLWCLREHDCS